MDNKSCENKTIAMNECDKHMKEDDGMNTTAEKKGYRRLDFSKLNFSDKKVSSEEALSDIVPIHWSEEVLQGKRKVIIKKTEDK